MFSMSQLPGQKGKQNKCFMHSSVNSDDVTASFKYRNSMLSIEYKDLEDNSYLKIVLIEISTIKIAYTLVYVFLSRL